MKIDLNAVDLYVVRYYPYAEVTNKYYTRLFNAIADLDVLYTGRKYSQKHNHLYRFLWSRMWPEDCGDERLNHLTKYDVSKIYPVWLYFLNFTVPVGNAQIAKYDHTFKDAGLEKVDALAESVKLNRKLYGVADENATFNCKWDDFADEIQPIIIN